MGNTKIISAGILLVLAGFGLCWADYVPAEHTALEVQKTADDMRLADNFYQGYKLYKYVTENHPDYEDIIYSYVGTAICAIETGNYPAAEEAVDTLLADFADAPRICKGLSDIAGEYRENKRFSLAAKLYNWLTANCAQGDLDIWAYGGLAASSAAVGDVNTAENIIDKLLNEFAQDQATPKILNDIGIGYTHSQDYARAEQVYRLVVDYWPSSDPAVWSQVGIIKAMIDQEKDATEEIDKLLTNYAASNVLDHCICSIAQCYKGKNYAKARQYFNYLLANWPESQQRIWARRDLIEMEVEAGNYDQADSLIADFLTVFRGHKQADGVLMNIAEEYEDLGEHARTEEICYQVISGWPGSKKAVGAQTKIAKMAINQQEFDKVRTAVDNLLMLPEYCRSEWITGPLLDITWQYRRANKPEECERIYNYIVANWPEPGYTGCTQKAAVVIANIGLGRDAQADALLERLIVDSNALTGLSRAVFQVGEQYYNEGDLVKAIAVWERIITELPESTTTAQAYDFIGDGYRRLGEYEMAIEYYTIVVEDWPDYTYASLAQFRIGRCYKHLRNAGVIPEDKANTLIKDAYMRVLENYPDSLSAKGVRIWLKNH